MKIDTSCNSLVFKRVFSLPQKLRDIAEFPVHKCVLLGQFPFIISLAEVCWSVVSYRIAGSLLVVERHIQVNHFPDLLDIPAPVYTEILMQFLLDPAVEGFVDGIVGRFTGT